MMISAGEDSWCIKKNSKGYMFQSNGHRRLHVKFYIQNLHRLHVLSVSPTRYMAHINTITRPNHHMNLLNPRFLPVHVSTVTSKQLRI